VRYLRSIVVSMSSILVFLFISSWALSISAQTTGQQITGLITDSTGAIVPNATVTALNEGTNATRSVVTNSDGNYVIPTLDVGTYTVSVTAAGFKKSVTAGVKLDVGDRLAINATMQPGDVTQSVQVQAASIHVETTTGEVSNLITGVQASQIQLNGRNFVQLIDLAPGTSSVYASGFALFGPYGVDAANQSINGLHPDDNSFLLDGVNNKDPGGPSSNQFVNVNPDALAEFNVVSAAQGAQYGEDSGAVINMVLKSGTTDFHGLAYEYLRNDAIQATAFGAITKPPLRYNNFGYNLGGPIFIPNKFNQHRDKLFFFFGQDLKRQSLSTPTFWSVPTEQEHMGNFSALPSAQWPINPTTGKPFTGGIIPSGQITANGQALLNLLPAPNTTAATGNFTFLTLSPVNTNQFILRADYHITPRNVLTFHWAHDDYHFLGNATNAIVYHPTVKGMNTAAQWTATINSTTVNKLSFSWEGGRISETQGIDPNPQLGITNVLRSANGLTYPSIYNASPDIPQVDFTAAGFTLFSATPVAFNNNSAEYAFSDDLTRIVGNHSLKVGMIVYRNRKNQTSPGALNGQFVFAGNSGQPALQGVANALLGTYNTYTETAGIPQWWTRFTDVEPYVADDWQVNRKLTVNLGFRYAYMGAVSLALNNGANFLPQLFNAADAPVLNPATGAFVSPLPTAANPYINGLALVGTKFPSRANPTRVPALNTLSSATLQQLFSNNLSPASVSHATWSPRLGFAFDPTGQQHTVVRGGFAVTYEQFEPNYPSGTVAQTPFIQTSVLESGSVNNPGGGAGTFSPGNLSAYNQFLKWPRVLNFTLGVEETIWGNSVVGLSYVGSTQADLTYLKNINQLQPGATLANPTTAVNALRPYLGYGDIRQLVNGGNSNYNSLQAQLRKPFQNGGIATLAYTWSKGLTDSQQYNYEPMNSYNLRADYGPAYYNRPQVFVASYVYPLPFWVKGDNWYKKGLGGWQVAGVTTISSGLPINVGNSTDVAGIGQIDNTTNAVYNGSAVTGKAERPDLVGNPYAGETNRYHHLNASAFANPAPGTFGDLQNFGIRGTLTSNWDASLQKRFPLTERLGLNFRAEAFNFPNHISFFSFNSTLGTSNFGTPATATDPRTFEFAARLEF
jgi:hypothetical protein